MNLDTYTTIFQKLLQSRVIFKCDRKILKTGKLKLFTVKQYFIRFHIETDKKDIKIFELPYPYNMTHNGEICTLDYRINTLTNNIQPITNKLKALKTNISFKMYDNIISIIPIKEGTVI